MPVKNGIGRTDTDLQTDEPTWKGLSDLEITRLRGACQTLSANKKRKNQHPVRDEAIFLCLLNTGLHVSELLSIDLDHYTGKHFTDVKRKGKERKFPRRYFCPPRLANRSIAILMKSVDETKGRYFLPKGADHSFAKMSIRS